MKKNLLFISALTLIVFAFASCNQSGPKDVVSDGTIYVKNDCSEKLYVQLAATNPNLSNGDEIYAKRNQISEILTVAPGATQALSYEFSKFLSSENYCPAVMVSLNPNRDGWWWYYYGTYNLYQITTTISVSKEGKDLVQKASFSEFADHVALHSEGETPTGEVQVENTSGVDAWVELVGFKDTGWDYPTALSKKVLLKAGETISIPYFSSDFGEGKNVLGSITYISYEKYTGTWRGDWGYYNRFPDKFIIKPITYNDNGYMSKWSCEQIRY